MRASVTTRRWVLRALAAGVATPVLAEAPVVSLRPLLRPGEREPLSGAEIVAQANFPGDVSFALADVRSGEMLEVLRPLLRQPPASTAKAMTALYALDRLGPDHRFVTRVVATGPVREGRVEGDLVLVGGGDPTLDTDGLGALAASVKAAGIHEVAGRFAVWPGRLPQIVEIDPLQPPHVAYNPAVGALNLNYNRVHFEWARGAEGYDVSLDARTASFSPRIATATMQVVDRSAPVYTYRRGEGVDEWTVARGALGTGGARWLPIRRPDLYAAEVFQTLARSHGIVLRRAEVLDAAPSGTEVARLESPALDVILASMLRYSTNLTAEVVGLAASAAEGDTPASLADSAERMNDWLGDGLGGRQPGLVDHSGLSGLSRITAADMTNALVRIGAGASLAGLLKPYPVAEAVVPLSVSAKTGTLNFVSALTGYLTTASGRELAFTILSSELDRRAALSEAERDRPPGGRAWAGRSRALQRELLANWAAAHS